MQFKNQESWDKGLLANKGDGYGMGVYRFAETWANLMEKRMEKGFLRKGKTIAEVASKAASDADTEGITGFMYGCAVSILAKCWKHGEELRLWHNLDTQIGSECEAANAKGTVLNPALLSIGKK